MFKQTIKSVVDLQSRYQLEAKTLPLEKKIDIAKDCLDKVKDAAEYLEIKETLKDLQNQRELEIKGFSPKISLLTKSEVEETLLVMNKETTEAEGKYLELQARFKKIEEDFNKEKNAISSEMKQIEALYRKAIAINRFLPYGKDSKFSAIKVDWHAYASIAAVKQPQTESYSLVAVATNPNKKAGK